MSKLSPGQPAPDFTLADQNNRIVQLSFFRGKQPVVLFFYPKDDTTGCTREACGFRDRFPEFLERDAAVLGISSDSAASHASFAAKYELPYPLLSDPQGTVRRLYGAAGLPGGILPGRVTFVIDRKGIVRHIFSSQFQLQRHVREALAGLSASTY